MFKLEDEAVKILDMIYAIADFPYIVEYKKYYEISSSKIGGIIDTLELLVESLMIIDLQSASKPVSSG